MTSSVTVSSLLTTVIIEASNTSSSTCIACRSLPSVVFFAVLFSFIVFIGVLGNTFVVAVIVSDRKLLNSSVNQFLLNLALADIGNLIFCSPDMALVLIDRGWLLPDFACHYLRFLQEYFLYASVLLQMSIGIERFLAICSPLRMQRFTSRTTVIVVVTMWSVAAAFATPYFLKQGIVHFPQNNSSYCMWKGISTGTRTLFKWAEFVVLYAFPLVLLTVLYTVMGRVLWGQKKSSNIADELQQVAILKLRRSVVKMLIISMLLYFLCYTPIQGIFIWESVLRRSLHMPSWLRLLINALSVMSSSANPIVYIMCCRHFHTRFVNLCRLPLSGSFSALAVHGLIPLLFVLLIVKGRKEDWGIDQIDWAFGSNSSDYEAPDPRFTKQVYEILLESWKDPVGSLEYFKSLQEGHGDQNLLEFAHSCVSLMEKIKELQQGLSVPARQASDTLLSLGTQKEFLKQTLSDRRQTATSLLDSFHLSPEEVKELIEFRKEVLKEIPELFAPNVAADLRDFIS